MLNIDNPIATINRKVLITALVSVGVLGTVIFLLIWKITSPKAGFDKARLTPIKCTIEAITVQKDEKYLFAGACLKQEPLPFELSYAGFLLRTNKNMSIDTSFGDGGRVFFLTSTESFTFKTVGVDSQEEDAIWVTGNLASNRSKKALQAFVAKFDQHGSLEQNFGNRHGLYIFDKANAYSITIEDSVIQNDHSLVVAGWQIGKEQKVSTFLRKIYTEGIEVPDFPQNESTIYGKYYAITRAFNGTDLLLTGESNDDILVTKYTENGSLVKDFGKKGTLLLDIKGRDEGRSIAAQTNSSILVGGVTDFKIVNRAKSGEGVVIGINGNGTISNHFGVDGVEFIENSSSDFSQVTAIRIENSGNFYALGSEGTKDKRQSIFIRFYSPFGHLNKSFGNAGKISFPGTSGAHSSLLNNDTLLFGGQSPDGRMLNYKFVKDDNKITPYIPVIPVGLSFQARIPEAIQKLFINEAGN